MRRKRSSGALPDFFTISTLSFTRRSTVKKAPELLREGGVSADMIYAVCSHGYGLCSEEEPKLEMEKVLFATDELTGLIWSCALMRPSKSTSDLEVKSLKKKFKDKKFAAGCSREVMSTRS